EGLEASGHCPAPVVSRLFADQDRKNTDVVPEGIMSTSQQCGKGKTLIMDATTLGAKLEGEPLIDQPRFGLNKMKNYYVQCKEHQSITAESRFEV
ncbi:hypothetical protein HAX54_040823, partial [Datura stramonium]|nr:hypothetical protein [Datura stramonium]